MPLYNIAVSAEIVFSVAQSPSVHWVTDPCPGDVSEGNERLSSKEECSGKIHPVFDSMPNIIEFVEKLLSDGYLCMLLFI